MGTLKKFYESIKDTIEEFKGIIEENCAIAFEEKTAEELATELGYEQFLTRIQYDLGVQESHRNLDTIEVKEIKIAYPIVLSEDRTFSMENYGVKNPDNEDGFKANTAVSLLIKNGYGAMIKYNHEKKCYELIVSKKTKKIEKTMQDIASKTSDLASSSKEKVGEGIKKSLHRLSDYADKNL